MFRLLPPLCVGLLIGQVMACGGGFVPPTAAPAPIVIEDVSDADLAVLSSTPGLTEDQRTALEEAFEAAHQAIADLRARIAAGELDQAEAAALARQIHADLLAAVEAILRGEEPGAIRPPLGLPEPAPPVFPGLSAEQMAQMSALRQALADFLRDVHDQLANGEITGSEARTLVSQKVLETNRAICAVLNPDQRTLFPVFCGGG